MLDELLYVFLRALEFDGDDPLPLINEWNTAVAHVQEVFNRMTDKDPRLAESKHGQWIPTHDADKLRCSQCDVIHLIAQYPHGEINYCPNCGARNIRQKGDAKMTDRYVLKPQSDYEGLKRKYVVLKSDTGECVENCFVLRPDKDPAAKAALMAYAAATKNEKLAEDIMSWLSSMDGGQGNG